jgi:hypothetical protein
MRTFLSESEGVLKTLTLYQLLSFEYFVQNSSSFLISSKFIIFCLFEIFLLLNIQKSQQTFFQVSFFSFHRVTVCMSISYNHQNMIQMHKNQLAKLNYRYLKKKKKLNKFNLQSKILKSISVF